MTQQPSLAATPLLSELTATPLLSELTATPLLPGVPSKRPSLRQPPILFSAN